MAGRPPKLIGNCTGHRTKAEREIRTEGEEKLLTGESLREWQEVKRHPVAHKHFLKLKRLYRSIDKDEALIENVINRYCIMQSECADYEKLYDRLNRDFDQLEEHAGELEFVVYLDKKTQLYNQLNTVDRQLQKKRAMLLAIEKENIMTLQGMLRAVPKRAAEDDEDDPMQQLLERRSNRGDGIVRNFERPGGLS